MMKKRKNNLKTTETGRSMVEMLGVLAVIGVLSVAGIAGYSTAMNKYRANEIINTASMLAIQARAANVGNGGCVELVTGTENPGVTNIAGVGVDIVASYVSNLDEVQVMIFVPNEDNCNSLKPMIEAASTDHMSILYQNCGSGAPLRIQCANSG